MRIENVKSGPSAVAAILVDGSTVTIGGIEVDCALEEADSSVCIQIMRTSDGTLVRGPLAPDSGAFVAEVLIPPRRHEPLQEMDDDGGTMTVSRPLPLDCERITLRLWPFAE